MASLHTIIDRHVPAVPWAGGDNIPWNDPEFSERMLAEHLSQDHDLASRRLGTIDAQVAWIHQSVLHGCPSRVLDLTCGPGLYLQRLGAMGHRGVGIDFSPASIRHATREAAGGDADLAYVEGDIRHIDFGSGFDLALILYGQLNVFRRHEATDILRRASRALDPGGALIVEAQTFEHVVQTGMNVPSWSSHHEGLFSPKPHVLLTESHWNDDERATTERFFVIDGDDGGVSVHAMTTVAYTHDEIVRLMAAVGLVDAEVAVGFPCPADENPLVTYVARAADPR